MKVICFDLDNTLVDSVNAHTKSYNQALKELEFKTVIKKYVFSTLGRPKEQVIKLLAPNATKKECDNIMRLHDLYLRKIYYKLVKRYKSSISILNFCRKKGYKLVLTSNCSKENIHFILKGARINKKYFNLIIGNDDVEYSKPAPDEILKAGKILKSKPMFVIGDSIYDIIAGKRAKVKTIGVTTGYYKEKQLNRYKPDYIIKNLNELKRIL